MQPVPVVTAADVERVVKRDFSTRAEDVLAVLREYGTAPWHREEHRVRLAILRLADGDSNALRRHLEVAQGDHRDVLAAAEYPRYMRDIPAAGDVPAVNRQAVIDNDWADYKAWLDRE